MVCACRSSAYVLVMLLPGMSSERVRAMLCTAPVELTSKECFAVSKGQLEPKWLRKEKSFVKDRTDKKQAPTLNPWSLFFGRSSGYFYKYRAGLGGRDAHAKCNPPL